MSSIDRAPVRPEVRPQVNIDMQREWTQPDVSSLGGLENDPDWVFRWVNSSFQGNTEIMADLNFERQQEGWYPVNAADHPENRILKTAAGADGMVRRKGQILMKMPRFTALSKKRQFEERAFARVNRTPKLVESNQDGKEMPIANDERMPYELTTSRTGEVMFGGNRKK